jgi:two-component system sensor histidine kinase TctE
MEVIQDSLHRALEKRIDLGYDGAEPGSAGIALDGNPTLLKELIRNLVDNAINYTPSTDDQPGVITARVQADTATGSVVLQVEDSGPGIGESERELVFQPFYRTLGTDADGTGLGLAIVQEIARRHGAEVQLDATHPGHHSPGARFTVRFDSRKESDLAQGMGMASRPSPPAPSLGPLL